MTNIASTKFLQLLKTSDVNTVEPLCTCVASNMHLRLAGSKLLSSNLSVLLTYIITETLDQRIMLFKETDQVQLKVCVGLFRCP